MDDAGMGIGLLLFPQMYQQLMQDGRKGSEEQKVMAVCPHCGSLNEHPYKFCKECGKRPEIPRDGPVNEGTFRICPYCGVTLDLPKRPRFCPYCTERLQ